MLKAAKSVLALTLLVSCPVFATDANPPVKCTHEDQARICEVLLPPPPKDRRAIDPRKCSCQCAMDRWRRNPTTNKVESQPAPCDCTVHCAISD